MQFENAELGLLANVGMAQRYGYPVTLRDTDAGEQLPIVKYFWDLKEAIAYAKRCVQG